MKPRLFDVRANAVPAEAPALIAPWRRIVLDPEYAGAWIVAGDVDGDGQAEIVSAKNVDRNDNHYTSSVVVHRLDGSVLWRWGDPKIGRNKLHHDVACQVYDWDGDGRNEIVVATEDSVVSLDGSSGEETRRFRIPRDAADCIVFVNLSGGERATDVLVKTRYGRIWAFDREGKLVWTIKEPGGYKTAHQPRPMDIDLDGRDEIMAGYALLNPDGTVRWDLRGKGLPLGNGHLDCARAFPAENDAAEPRVVLTGCSDNCVAMVDSRGNVLWSLTGRHFESLDIGKVCPDIPGQQIVVDIAYEPCGGSPLWVLSEEGELLGQIITDDSRLHLLIDWFGCGAETMVIGKAGAVFDGRGGKVAVLDMPIPQGEAEVLCLRGDLDGDGIPELVLSANPAREVYLFRSPTGRKLPGMGPLGTGVNFTLY